MILILCTCVPPRNQIRQIWGQWKNKCTKLSLVSKQKLHISVSDKLHFINLSLVKRILKLILYWKAWSFVKLKNQIPVWKDCVEYIKYCKKNDFDSLYLCTPKKSNSLKCKWNSISSMLQNTWYIQHSLSILGFDFAIYKHKWNT
jgi:hypothetical protein